MPLLIMVSVVIFAFFQEFWDLLKQPKYRSIIFWVCITLVVGTLVFSRLEGWSLVDSFYFCVVTLSTVGYGDFQPTTTAGKMFDVFYILFGLSLLATFLRMLAQERQFLFEERRSKKTNKSQE